MKVGSLMTAALILCTATANAADGSKLLGACTAAVTQERIPPGMTGEGYIKFCQCLVAKAADNQAVIDEYVGIATSKPDEVQAKLAASSQSAQAIGAACQDQPFPPQPQLEIRVPFEPTAFPSGEHTYLSYELYLTNLSPSPMTITRVEVLSSDAADTRPIAAFEGQRLDLLLQPAAAPVSTGESGPQQLAAGTTIIVFMWVPFENNSSVPASLRHRIVTAAGSVEGALIRTHRMKLEVLGPPLLGGDWLAADGPSNDQDNHHRRGVLVLNGHATISRRDAIDWKRVENGVSFSGDPRDRRSYYSYGARVLAVADAKVVRAVDGLPENVPGHGDAFRPAVPITMETIGGNSITLDLGDGQYAYYFHLQPKSLRVKVGEQVRRGQPIAQVGCSGDAREPHLHFEVTTSANLMAGEGLPYLISHYRIRMANDEWPARIRELPLSNTVIDFGRSP
jgi:hypothetical protein